MATQIQAYKTSNGILFENESDALKYETFLVEKKLNFVNLIAEINELLINQNVKHRDTQEILQVTEINSASQFINKCMVDTSFINCSGLTKVIYNIFENHNKCVISKIVFEEESILIINFQSTPNIFLSSLISNFKTVSSRLIRKKFHIDEYFWEQKYYLHSNSAF